VEDYASDNYEDDDEGEKTEKTSSLRDLLLSNLLSRRGAAAKALKATSPTASDGPTTPALSNLYPDDITACNPDERAALLRYLLKDSDPGDIEHLLSDNATRQPSALKPLQQDSNRVGDVAEGRATQQRPSSHQLHRDKGRRDYEWLGVPPAEAAGGFHIYLRLSDSASVSSVTMVDVDTMPVMDECAAAEAAAEAVSQAAPASATAATGSERGATSDASDTPRTETDNVDAESAADERKREVIQERMDARAAAAKVRERRAAVADRALRKEQDRTLKAFERARQQLLLQPGHGAAASTSSSSAPSTTTTTTIQPSANVPEVVCMMNNYGDYLEKLGRNKEAVAVWDQLVHWCADKGSQGHGDRLRAALRRDLLSAV
jgi:hypothetical protein